jgi:hypothetical protein
MLNKLEYATDRNSKRIVNSKQLNDNINSDTPILEKVDNVELTINGYEYIKGGRLLDPHIPNLITLNHFNLKTTLENKCNFIPSFDVEISQKNKFSEPYKLQNKNAYEIRESILGYAIDIVKFSSNNKDITTDLMTDKVLEIAQKFYKFVENKRY